MALTDHTSHQSCCLLVFYQVWAEPSICTICLLLPLQKRGTEPDRKASEWRTFYHTCHGPRSFIFVILWRHYWNSCELIPIYHFKCNLKWEWRLYIYGTSEVPSSGKITRTKAMTQCQTQVLLILHEGSGLGKSDRGSGGKYVTALTVWELWEIHDYYYCHELG